MQEETWNFMVYLISETLRGGLELDNLHKLRHPMTISNGRSYVLDFVEVWARRARFDLTLTFG